jgi:hypothetical protein
MTPKKFPWKATVQVRGSCDSQASPGSTKKNAHPNGPVGGIQDGSAWEASDGSGEAYGGSSSDFVSSGGGGVANNNSSSREGGGALWHEGSLTWTTAPFIQDDEVGKVVCSWSGVAEEVYPDEAGPRECDVTALAKEHAEGHLCLTIDMVTKPPLPPPPWTTPPLLLLVLMMMVMLLLLLLFLVLLLLLVVVVVVVMVTCVFLCGMSGVRLSRLGNG